MTRLRNTIHHDCSVIRDKLYEISWKKYYYYYYSASLSSYLGLKAKLLFYTTSDWLMWMVVHNQSSQLMNPGLWAVNVNVHDLGSHATGSQPTLVWKDTLWWLATKVVQWFQKILILDISSFSLSYSNLSLDAPTLIHLQSDHTNCTLIPAFYPYLQAQDASSQIKNGKEQLKVLYKSETGLCVHGYL